MRFIFTHLLPLFAITLGIGAGSAHAQLIKDLSDLDPFNKNSGIRQGGRDLDNARLDQMSRTPRAGRDYTKLYFKNNTDRRIYLAVRFLPFAWSDGTTSELSLRGSSWETRAWYNLAPGQKVHVGNTKNVYVYYYAQGDGLEWAGKHNVRVRDGNRTRLLGFRTDTIGIGTPETWTFNLNR
jgi:hypothetical protein